MVDGTVRATRISSITHAPEPRETGFLDASQIPPRRQSLRFSTIQIGGTVDAGILDPENLYPGNWSQSVQRTDSMDASFLQPEYMPPPLSVAPRKPSSPYESHGRPQALSNSKNHVIIDAAEDELPHHSRGTSTETTSWLDTIDDSAGSSASSFHSRNSHFGVGRKRIPLLSDDPEAELRAAMDAAVEAAYNDSYDMAETETVEDESDTEVALKAKNIVERARQEVREAEQEDAGQGKMRGQDEQGARSSGHSIALDYLDEEAEEEERLIEEMTKGYFRDDFQFGIQSKSGLPQQSDPSVFSGRTWASTNSSQTGANAASIAGLTEGVQVFTYQKLPPPHPPPAGALPVPPPSAAIPPLPPAPSLPPPRPPSVGASPGPGVRDRRLSGQNAKQLKIETQPRPSSATVAKKDLLVDTQIYEVSAVPAESSQPPHPNDRPSPRPPLREVTQAAPLTPVTSVHSGSSIHSESPVTSALTRTETQDVGEPIPASPARFAVGRPTLATGLLRKNMSSSSLKMRNLSVTTAEGSDWSPITPGSATFSISTDHRKGMIASTPVLPTPTGSSFKVDGASAGGMYLFDDQICSPSTPSTAGTWTSNAPLPLEPCPESFLLRPFWLMRCLYQTIAHPRGGYLSTKLFVPRDVWLVKNVKIKGLEDKIANCDLLTAALLKLSKVDTLNADAVLEEMQSFETIIDQVRNTLHKKLGSEVGVQSSAALFKASPASEDAGNQADALWPKGGGNSSNKSYLSSWRKLRSKTSGAGLTTLYNAPHSREGSKETLSMSSLPMTSNPGSRPQKRNTSQPEVSGPNAHYMGAVARLFDAAQILGKQSVPVSQIAF